jgi:hypothetical protein
VIPGVQRFTGAVIASTYAAQCYNANPSPPQRQSSGARRPRDAAGAAFLVTDRSRDLCVEARLLHHADPQYELLIGQH